MEEYNLDRKFYQSTIDNVTSILSEKGWTLGNPEGMRFLIPKATEEAAVAYLKVGTKKYIHNFKKSYGPLKFSRKKEVVIITAYNE